MNWTDAVVKQAKWDTSKVREKLRRDINAHIAEVRAAKLCEITKAYEVFLKSLLILYRNTILVQFCLKLKIDDAIIFLQERLAESLSGPVEALLDEANDETWATIRKLLHRETESAVSGFIAALSGFDLDEEVKERMVCNLRDYARGVVETKAKEEAGRVLIHMKER